VDSVSRLFGAIRTLLRRAENCSRRYRFCIGAIPRRLLRLRGRGNNLHSRIFAADLDNAAVALIDVSHAHAHARRVIFNTESERFSGDSRMGAANHEYAEEMLRLPQFALRGAACEVRVWRAAE
jgi:hypothetical protein